MVLLAHLAVAVADIMEQQMVLLVILAVLVVEAVLQKMELLAQVVLAQVDKEMLVERQEIVVAQGLIPAEVAVAAQVQ
jgi:hypothetical protein